VVNEVRTTFGGRWLEIPPVSGHAARRQIRRLLAALVLGCAAGAAAITAIDGFDFDDEADAARYQSLIAEFRCPKCLNTNLAGSDAPIATDLRRTVRQLVLEGKSDQQVRDYLQARYGDFVLYDPPVAPRTWILWFAPALMILIGIVVLRRVGARRGTVEMTAEERQRVRELTGEPVGQPLQQDAATQPDAGEQPK